MKRRGEPIPLLAPLGWVYLVASSAHHFLYDRGWRRVESVAAPVVSIGNLTAGGVGKTPAAIWLAERLAAPGRGVAIVSRGYRGERDEDPLVVARERDLLATARQAGDEPVMIAMRGCARLVVVGRDRVAAARLAIRQGADLILLDDGFQHRRLARRLDIVLLDHDDPLGGGRGLPAGWLREAPRALARADMLLLTRCPQRLAARESALGSSEIPARLGEALERLPPGTRPPVFASLHEVSGLVAEDGALVPPESLHGRAVVAASGIARPDAFRATLDRLGARVARELRWPDHHAFDGADADRIRAAVAESGAQIVVTTEKDAVRWPPAAPHPWVLRVGLRVGAERTVVETVNRMLEERGSAGR